MYNIASKVVATVSVDDVKENVNLYLDSGNLFQLTKKYLLELHNALPKTITLHVSCDALGISGHIKGVK